MDDTMEVRSGGLRNFQRAYMRHRYSILFYSLLFILVAVPVLNTFRYGGILVDSMLAANLLAAIMPANLGKNRTILLTVMIIVWLTRPLALWLDQPTLSVIHIRNMDVDWSDSCRSRFALCIPRQNYRYRTCVRSTQRLSSRRTLLRPFVLGPRTARTRRVHHIRGFFANDCDLLQLRDARNAGLWRHRAPHRRSAKSGDFGRCRRTTLSRRAGRAIG